MLNLHASRQTQVQHVMGRLFGLQCESVDRTLLARVLLLYIVSFKVFCCLFANDVDTCSTIVQCEGRC